MVEQWCCEAKAASIHNGYNWLQLVLLKTAKWIWSCGTYITGHRSETGRSGFGRSGFGRSEIGRSGFGRSRTGRRKIGDHQSETIIHLTFGKNRQQHFHMTHIMDGWRERKRERGREESTCQANGTWSSVPHCVIVSCPLPLEDLEHGRR